MEAECQRRLYAERKDKRQAEVEWREVAERVEREADLEKIEALRLHEEQELRQYQRRMFEEREEAAARAAELIQDLTEAEMGKEASIVTAWGTPSIPWPTAPPPGSSGLRWTAHSRLTTRGVRRKLNLSKATPRTPQTGSTTRKLLARRANAYISRWHE